MNKMSKLSFEGFELLKNILDTEESVSMYPFIIDGKRMTVQFTRNEYLTYIAVVKISEDYMPYEYWCSENFNTELKVIFNSIEEFNDKVEKLNICKHHTKCLGSGSGGCPSLFLTSPLIICGICHDTVEGHLLEQTNCKHQFCLKCLNEYVSTRPNKCCTAIPCPMCRADLKHYSHSHVIEFRFSEHLMVD